MKIAGIVAEYNPFHNGHAYQINMARSLTNCDTLIVAMSGDFVQRGTPAVIDKELRTISALNSGADMVLQIPVFFSTASAEAFAYGSVALLVAAGIDVLVFGCEDPSLSVLQALAALYIEEPDDYKANLQNYLKQGISFPIARSYATADYLLNENCPGGFALTKEELSQLLKQPNNILAIEYIKALKRLENEGRLEKTIELCPIKRIGTDYHSLSVNGEICSATALRNLFAQSTVNGWHNYVPSTDASLLESYFATNNPVTENDFSNELNYCLLTKKAYGFSDYADGNEELSNRIINQLSTYTSFSDFCKSMQTKDITYARISRFLLHILLNITEQDMLLLKANPVPYIRVLGFKKERSDILSHIAARKSAPLLSNVKKATSLLDKNVLSLLQKDLFARELYLTKVTGKNDYIFPVML